MSLLLYAIKTAGETVRGRGLGGQPLHSVDAQGLAAIVGPAPGGGTEPDEGALWKYEEVQERLMAHHVILPARFGTVLADETAVRALLRDRELELRRALDRVCGSVEFGITTAWHDPDEPREPASGTAYLLSRLTRDRRACEVARLLHPLSALSRSSRQRVLPRPSLPVTASYLVESHRSDEFIEMVAYLDGQLGDVDVVCTGPWPPYSFAQGVAP